MIFILTRICSLNKITSHSILKSFAFTYVYVIFLIYDCNFVIHSTMVLTSTVYKTQWCTCTEKTRTYLLKSCLALYIQQLLLFSLCIFLWSLSPFYKSRPNFPYVQLKTASAFINTFTIVQFNIYKSLPTRSWNCDILNFLHLSPSFLKTFF